MRVVAQAKQKSCFVIAPIGDEESQVRVRSDEVYKHIIEPVVNELGYTPTRADKITDPGMITNQIIERLLDDDLVVADLTGRNANVLYELAIRHATRKPVVLMVENAPDIPFDVSQSRAILFDIHSLTSADKCKRTLGAQVRALEHNPDDVFSPVSQAIDLRRMRDSDVPSAQRDARIISMVESLQSDIARLERSVTTARETTRIRNLDPYAYSAYRYRHPALSQLRDDLSQLDVDYKAAPSFLGLLGDLFKKWAHDAEANEEVREHEEDRSPSDS